MFANNIYKYRNTWIVLHQHETISISSLTHHDFITVSYKPSSNMSPLIPKFNANYSQKYQPFSDVLN